MVLAALGFSSKWVVATGCTDLFRGTNGGEKASGEVLSWIARTKKA